MIHPKWRLLISLLMGVLTTAGFWWGLKKSKQDLEKKVTQVSILRAKRYIKMGRPITKNLVEEVRLPKAYLEPKALQKTEDLFHSNGQARFKARLGLLAGEQITLSKLVDDRTRLGLAWVLDVDHVAVTLQLRQEQAIGGWVQPGDRVVLFHTMQKQLEWPKSKTYLLYESIRVLSVGIQQWDPLAPLSSKKNRSALETGEVLITLSLLRKQAVFVLLAAKKGSLHLGLVSPLSNEAQTRTVANLSLLSQK